MRRFWFVYRWTKTLSGMHWKRIYFKEGLVMKTIVYLCGDRKFKEDFQKMREILTLEGKVVISLFDKDIESFKRMPKNMIDICNMIYVVNRDGYINDVTKNEIKYSYARGKGIMFLEDFNKEVLYYD